MRFALLAAIMIAAPASAQTTAADSAAAVGTVQRLFDAMATGDTLALRGLLLRGMHFVSLTDPPAAAPRMQTDSAFIQAFAARRQKLLERMWQPVARVQGPIATVWAPYDFHIDGKFSHCGIDTATLLRTPQGWVISALVYTVKRTGCDPSPLGPPAE